jgi:hypothetical protein
MKNEIYNKHLKLEKFYFIKGFVLVPRDRKQTDLMVVTHIPFTLYPSPFKRAHFEKITNLQPNINDLVYKIANNTDFMEDGFAE